MHEDAINSIRSYLKSRFPNSTIQRSPEAREGKKSKAEFDYVATMFFVSSVDRVLYVSDVLMADAWRADLLALLERYNVAEELSQAGRYPLLLTVRGVMLMLEWLGPRELTEEDVGRYAPNKPGVYLLVEPFEGGSWKGFFVDRHEHLRSQLQLFTRAKEFGKVRSYFFTLVETGDPAAQAVRDRITKFIARACQIDDPTDPRLEPLAVNLPPDLAT